MKRSFLIQFLALCVVIAAGYFAAKDLFKKSPLPRPALPPAASTGTERVAGVDPETGTLLPGIHSRKIATNNGTARLTLFIPERKKAPLVLVFGNDSDPRNIEHRRAQSIGTSLMADGLAAIVFQLDEIALEHRQGAVAKASEIFKHLGSVNRKLLGVAGYGEGAPLALALGMNMKSVRALAVDGGSLHASDFPETTGNAPPFRLLAVHGTPSAAAVARFRTQYAPLKRTEFTFTLRPPAPNDGPETFSAVWDELRLFLGRELGGRIPPGAARELGPKGTSLETF